MVVGYCWKSIWDCVERPMGDAVFVSVDRLELASVDRLVLRLPRSLVRDSVVASLRRSMEISVLGSVYHPSDEDDRGVG